MTKPIQTITVPKTERGTLQDGVLVLPAPKRLASKITRIAIWLKGAVHVYATEPLDDGTVLRWGDVEVSLTWNDSRQPPRAEGMLSPEQAALIAPSILGD